MSAETIPTRRRYTPKEYLALEREAEFKSEYINGEIRAMAGGSPKHSTIIINLAREVSTQLRRTPCQAFSSETKVKSGPLTSYFYPDMTVVCGEPQYFDQWGEILMNPKVIFEVLSPSTEAFDRGEKFARYRQLDSLTDYVLIQQTEPLIEHYARQTASIWMMTEIRGWDAVLSLPSIGCTLRLADLYDRITFSPEGDDKTEVEAQEPPSGF